MDIWDFQAINPNFLREHSGEILGGWEVVSGKVGRREGDTSPVVAPYSSTTDLQSQAAKQANLARYVERVERGLWPLSDTPFSWDDSTD